MLIYQKNYFQVEKLLKKVYNNKIKPKNYIFNKKP